MKVNKLILLVLGIIGAFYACSSSDDSEPQDIIPNNLTVNFNVVGSNSNNPNGDGSGVVNITASATNAANYVFRFPDNSEQQSTSGNIMHTFTTEGTNSYSISITAISSTGNTISTSESVTVFVGTSVEEIVPTNLTISFSVVGSGSSTPYGDGSGVVNFSASAIDAVSYGYSINGNVEVMSSDGSFQYTFDDVEGIENNLVLVKAYSSTNNSIEEQENVPVAYYLDGLPTWADEFFQDGSPNASNWTYDLGAGGWGNNEAQTYTDNSENVTVENGLLKITAKKDGATYTSARLKTQGLFSFKYGRAEIRAKLPSSMGTWPAIWMMGTNFATDGWPRCGEIDIMEQTGQDKNKVLATCHWSDPNNPDLPLSYGLDTTVSDSTSNFHVYALEWDSTLIRVFVDDVQYYVIDISTSGIPNTPFQNDFFFILNVAMGGTLGGNIPSNFTESSMEIDYVRVYQN